MKTFDDKIASAFAKLDGTRGAYGGDGELEETWQIDPMRIHRLKRILLQVA